MEWKEKRALMDKELKSKFVPVLKSHGFKGTYPHFRRLKDKIIDVLGIQFSQWGAQFYIEAATAPIEGVDLGEGKFVAPESVKHYHTGNRMRLGEIPFDFENGMFAEVAQKAIDAITDGEKWWESQISKYNV